MVEEIVRQLPSDLEWMVMFRIRSIQKFTDNQTIINMYFLNQHTAVDQFDFVVLTSIGRYLYKQENNTFTDGENLIEHQFNTGGLLDEYSEKLNLFDINTADSLATGIYPEYGQVILYIHFKEKVAIARSVFNRPPSQKYYDYLQAVGIRYVSGQHIGSQFLTTYENTLSKHIASGILADFSRTDNCNLFFFLHGNINSVLADGILTAGKKRIQYEKRFVSQKLKELAVESMNTQLKMEVIQPFGEPSFKMGDVVPKGFIYGALSQAIDDKDFVLAYQKSLENDKLRGLWTFEKDDLETSIDSALVIMNTFDRDASLLLKKFEDQKTKAYLPQTDAVLPKEGDMLFVEEKKHWCQPDFSISALILSILKRHNLDVENELIDFVNENFEKRSGLYFSNPYFVDWLYAKGLNISNTSGELKTKLINEILSSVNSDFSLGTFDKVFSTACGVLALQELGCDANLIFSLQLYILNNYQKPSENNPIPFYSSLIINSNKEGRTCTINGTHTSIYLYKDIHSMIYLSLVAMSLNISTDQVTTEINVGLQEYIDKVCPNRYACTSIEEYIEQHSLSNYL